MQFENKLNWREHIIKQRTFGHKNNRVVVAARK